MTENEKPTGLASTVAPGAPPSLFDLGPTQRLTVAAPARPTGLTEAAKRGLIAKGHMDEDTGATRKAKHRRCDVCRRQVWRGFNADFGFMSVDCDPQVLTAAGELEAIIAGIRTFTLRYRPGYGHIFDGPRCKFNLIGAPAGQGRYDVIAEHQHEPHGFDSGKSRLNDKPAAETPDGPPPF